MSALAGGFLSGGMWKDILTQLWHTAVLYAVAFLVLRLSGKRSISRMAPFDVVVVIMIGEAVAIGVEEPSKPILSAVVPVVVLGLLQFLLAWVNARSQAVERVTQGSDTVVVRDGQVLTDKLLAEHISLNDLQAGLREQGVADVRTVKEARLEPNGKISVLLKPEASPLTAGAAGLDSQETLESLLDRKFAEWLEKMKAGKAHHGATP